MKRLRQNSVASPRLAVTASFLVLVGIVAGAMLTGCGSSNTNVPVSTMRAQQPTGRASISIQWPSRTTVAGRLIPFTTNSILLRLTSADGSKLLGSTLLARPSGGGSASATFDRVTVGQAMLTATAYPNADGSGVAQASAKSPVTVVQNQTTVVALTLASTIQKLTVTPAVSSLSVGQSVTLIATATDSSGNVVLISPSTLTWASSAITAATVDAGGVVKGITAGTVTITATETESGISGTATATFGAAPTPAPPAKGISFAAPVATVRLPPPMLSQQTWMETGRQTLPYSPSVIAVMSSFFGDTATAPLTPV